MKPRSSIQARKLYLRGVKDPFISTPEHREVQRTCFLKGHYLTCEFVLLKIGYILTGEMDFEEFSMRNV